MKDLLYRLIHQWHKDNTPLLIQSGEVVLVEGNTCDIETEKDVVIYGVKLNAISTEISNNHQIVPKVGSIVLFGLVENNPSDAVVIAYSEIEKIEVKIEDNSFLIDNKGHVFNGGNFGGLIKIQELTKQLAKMTTRIDGIIDAINKGVPVPQDGGTALHISIKTALTTLVDVEDFGGIENEKVKH